MHRIIGAFILWGVKYKFNFKKLKELLFSRNQDDAHLAAIIGMIFIFVVFIIFLVQYLLENK